MERNSKGKAAPRTLGFLTKRDRAREEPRDAKADAAAVAYARRVLNDPDTEWVDWDDVKRELADKSD